MCGSERAAVPGPFLVFFLFLYHSFLYCTNIYLQLNRLRVRVRLVFFFFHFLKCTDIYLQLIDYVYGSLPSTTSTTNLVITNGDTLKYFAVLLPSDEWQPKKKVYAACLAQRSSSTPLL